MEKLGIFIVHGDPEVRALWGRFFERASKMFAVVGGGLYLSAEEAMAALRGITPPPDLVLTSLRFCPLDDSEISSQAQAISVYEKAMAEGISFVRVASGICPVFVVSGAIELWLMEARKAGAAWVGFHPDIVEEADLPEIVYQQYLTLAETTA